MPVSSSEIIAYCSTNMPESNSTPSGGAIDTTCKAIFTDISAADTLEALSNNGADTTQTITVTGRNASGIIVTDTMALNGVSVIPGASATSFTRILKIVMSGSATGTVTIRKASDDVTIATLEPGVTKVRRLFYDSSADASGGSTRQFYEKIFIKNTNATLAVTNAVVSEFADPSTFVDFALESGINGITQASGRLNTIPSGMVSGSFSSLSRNVPSGGNLGPGSGIGVWLRLQLAAGASPTGTTYTVRLAGQST
jgi:hypothetical protein